MKITTGLERASIGRANALQGVAPQTMVFVDAAIGQGEALVAELRGEYRVVHLAPSRDGVGQISEALAACRGLVAIHILAHGIPGCLRLGSINLSLSTLYWHAEQLAGWRAALGPRAKILIHGSEVGLRAEGEALLRRMRELTGAELTLVATSCARSNE